MGEPITVSVMPERMEITSFPGPDKEVSLEDMRRGKSPTQSPRNPRIGEMLKALKLVEARGTGISRIFRAMQINGSGNPIFKTDEVRTFFTVILPVHAAFQETTPQPVKSESEKKRRRSAKEIRALILRAFARRKELSTSTLSKALGYKRVNNTLSKIIHDLVDEKVLVYTHPESLKNRNQKLRLAK